MASYCIRGNNRITHKKEILSDGYRSEEEAHEHLQTIARLFRRTHSYARVARSDAYVHPSRR